MEKSVIYSQAKGGYWSDNEGWVQDPARATAFREAEVPTSACALRLFLEHNHAVVLPLAQAQAVDCSPAVECA